jgi:hypothetical protein
VAVTSLPLRRPAVWNTTAAFGTWSLVYGCVLLAVGVGIGILTLSADRTPHAPLYAVVGGGGMAALGLVAIGVSFRPRAQPPVLVNAVAVTPSTALLPDDWVHLFRRRRMAPVFSIGLVALGLYMLTIAGGTAYLVAVGVEDAGLLLFAVIPLLSGLGMLGYGLREMVSRQRLSTFGRAPTGLTLGTSGITLLDPHRTRHIPWSRVLAVRADNGRTRGGKSALYPIVVLTVAPDAAGPDAQPATQPEEVTLQMLQYVVDRAVVFSALATAFEDPGFRAELGSAGAQTLLDRWVVAAAER